MSSSTPKYFERLYRTLLTTPVLDMAFSKEFKQEMLSFGYSCTFDEAGGITIGSGVPKGLRASGTTNVGDGETKGYSLRYAMETFTGNEVYKH